MVLGHDRKLLGAVGRREAIADLPRTTVRLDCGPNPMSTNGVGRGEKFPLLSFQIQTAEQIRRKFTDSARGVCQGDCRPLLALRAPALRAPALWAPKRNPARFVDQVVQRVVAADALTAQAVHIQQDGARFVANAEIGPQPVAI